MLSITLQDGNFKFSCPSCRAPMHWFVVRHILSSVMSNQELQQSLDTINKNFVKQRPDIRQCSVCKTNQMRDFTKKWYGNKNRVVCNECSSKAGHEKSFCWICCQPWQSGSKGCGNSNCNGDAAKLKELERCSLKKLGLVTCPDTRACPKCGVLIYHIDKCKHMKCAHCYSKFCFVCLQLPNSDEKYPCGGAHDACTVAPRQTSIPN